VVCTDYRLQTAFKLINYYVVNCGVGNTSNLKSHLRVHHVTEYAVLKNAELAEKKVRQSEGDNNQASTNATTLKQTQLQQSSLQTSSTKFSHDHPKQKLITEKIAQMICKDLRPYSIVDDLGFRAALKAAEPRYVMPSWKTFSDEIIPKMYAEIIAVVKSDVEGAASLAYATDAWTSCANQGYLSYTAHFLTSDFAPRNYCLSVENVDESHTALNLAKSLSEQTVSWTTESQRGNKLKLAVVSDNAANIQAAISKVPSCLSVKCFDHTL